MENKRKGSHPQHELLPSPSPSRSVHTALHSAVGCWALKLLPLPQKYESIPQYRPTLTTTKSPVIPGTLLGCQSYWSCQNNCLTTGFCEAEHKAEPLNKNQIHKPNAFIHLAFPLSPTHPPAPFKQRLSLIQLSSFSAPQYQDTQGLFCLFLFVYLKTISWMYTWEKRQSG